VIADEIREFKANELIFSEDEIPEGAFIVKEGIVQIFHTISRENGVVEVEIDRVGPRGIFGEMGLIAHQPRSASARALAPTKAVFIPRAVFLKHIDQLPPWVNLLIRSFVRRLRDSNRMLYQLLEESNGPACQELLASKGAAQRPGADDSGERILKELGHE
jgi:CRP-like cAMP-binding protein